MIQGDRQILKAKRKVKEETKLIDDDGNEISFEDDSDHLEEDTNNVQYIDEQEVVQVDDDWEDEGNVLVTEVIEEEQKKESKKKKKKKTPKEKELWNDTKEPLKEDELLEFDSSAYEMLHRSNPEWPCLSIDVVLRDRCPVSADQAPLHNCSGWFPSEVTSQLTEKNSKINTSLGVQIHNDDKFPMTVYFCGGSQSEKKAENKIYVMKWSQMEKTLNDDDVPEDNSEDDEEDIIEKLNSKIKEPLIRYESIPHRGCVNRIRAMHGSPIVATWNDEGEVGIYNISSALIELDKEQEEELPKKKKKGAVQKKNFGGTKIAQFRHKQEGYALEWSPLTKGRLASGSCDAQLFLYTPVDEYCSTFIKETQVGLQGHKGSIEDIQWSPSQEHVLATCSVDQTIKLWDLRATQMKPQMSFIAHDCDVNVMAWNTHTKFLLASGDDKGEFKIWDLRMLGANNGQKEMESITRIRWHTSAITSISFEPREESVLAVCSADNKLTLWDFSVEVDEQELVEQKLQTNGLDIPAQLMFLHQGQRNMKELRFHPQYRSLLLTTAEDSFNIFRPNLDPDFVEQAIPEEDEENEEDDDEEMTEATDQKTSIAQGGDFHQDSDDDMDREEQRVRDTQSHLAKKRQARSKSRHK